MDQEEEKRKNIEEQLIELNEKIINKAINGMNKFQKIEFLLYISPYIKKAIKEERKIIKSLNNKKLNDILDATYVKTVIAKKFGVSETLCVQVKAIISYCEKYKDNELLNRCRAGNISIKKAHQQIKKKSGS